MSRPRLSKKYDFSQNADVERVRRAHQNDLENIPIFLILALFYVTTDPDPDMAKVQCDNEQ